MATIPAFIAVQRFGLGARVGELEAVGADARAWLLAQLLPLHARPPALAALPTTMEALTDVDERRAALKDDTDPAAKRDDKKDMRQALRHEHVSEVAVRTRVAVQSQAPFFERLVAFWSNHFTVSAKKQASLPLVAAFERDAIRPHVLGRFEELLRAATRHPAMLLYLDNARSIGPHSKRGRRQSKGLNENLARELLELHTLGVGGGYTQADVQALAMMLTGWTVADPDLPNDGSGARFVAATHEPGDKVLLGTTYVETGAAEVDLALTALAAHPATARFLATKLARHFIADEPPAAAVDALVKAYRASDGQLIALYRTLIGLDVAWQDPLVKLRTPSDYVIALLRATDIELPDKRLTGLFARLGQVPFAAASPAGWSDRAKDWMSAEALIERVDVARDVARRIARDRDPDALLAALIGPVASEATKQAVARAGSRVEAFTLLFASPELQRR